MLYALVAKYWREGLIALLLVAILILINRPIPTKIETQTQTIYQDRIVYKDRVVHKTQTVTKPDGTRVETQTQVNEQTTDQKHSESITEGRTEVHAQNMYRLGLQLNNPWVRNYRDYTVDVGVRVIDLPVFAILSYSPHDQRWGIGIQWDF